MSTAKATDAGIPPNVMAELEYAAQLAASGRKDPTFARRIAEEAARIREEVYARVWPSGHWRPRHPRAARLMKYVLDSCVAFKTLLAEQDSDKAQRLCEDYQKFLQTPGSASTTVSTSHSPSAKAEN